MAPHCRSSPEARRNRIRRTPIAMSTGPATPQTSEISIAHSPDSDDAFMFYALATGKLRVPGLKFTHALSDIESLNHASQNENYDVTAVSVYAHAIKKTELKGRKVAIPGTRTTSYLALKLFEPGVETITMPFDKILDAVAA